MKHVEEPGFRNIDPIGESLSRIEVSGICVCNSDLDAFLGAFCRNRIGPAVSTEALRLESDRRERPDALDRKTGLAMTHTRPDLVNARGDFGTAERVGFPAKL